MTVNIASFTLPQFVDYVRKQAPQFGIDAAAALALTGPEGIGGNIGDNGHAFGPWQLNDAGGTFPAAQMGLTTVQKQAWAWSPEGIDYALSQMQAAGAGGLTGAAAITKIATAFEKPRAELLPGEIATAIQAYPQWGEGMPIPVPIQGNGSIPSTGQAKGQTTTSPPAGGISAGSIGPFAISLPTGLILALIGVLLLFIGAMLFAFNVQNKATSGVSNFVSERT